MYDRTTSATIASKRLLLNVRRINVICRKMYGPFGIDQISLVCDPRVPTASIPISMMMARVVVRRQLWRIVVQYVSSVRTRQSISSDFLDVILTSGGAYSRYCGRSSEIVSSGDFDPTKMCFSLSFGCPGVELSSSVAGMYHTAPGLCSCSANR